MRAEDANDHNAFLNRMRHFQPIKVADLKIYKTLTAEDMKQDPAWQFCPIIVATNRERYEIIHWQARRFAKMHNTHVLP